MSPGENRLLALSGGGYRAMLCHVGALWRLNELGELSKLTHVSSVSGGSLIAGLMAAKWRELKFDDDGIAQDFRAQIVEPLIRLASHTIDYPSVLVGLLPFISPAQVLDFFYRRYLFGNTKLGQLPPVPRFYFNATNFQTGAIWTFSRDVMGDFTVGEMHSEGISLARAVAAASAFPPFLAPLTMRLQDAKWKMHPSDSPLRAYDDLLVPSARVPDEHLRTFRQVVVLADGGISDNLGLVPLWRERGDLFISDGGGIPSPEPSP